MLKKIQEANRLVIKVGSSLLIDKSSDQINHEWLQSLVTDIAYYHNLGTEIIIICSGSIALGRRQLSLTAQKSALKLQEKQATAAVGQILLNHAWQEAFAQHKMNVAQMLLTYEDTETRRRHLNARNTLLQLLKFRTIPIINENDTVATAEIRYGDNDRLAARLAVMGESDLLILLSDIDGLYSANPTHDNTAKHISQIDEITPEITAMAIGKYGNDGTGGMATKIEAAKIAIAGGCQMIISNGMQKHPLTQIAGQKYSLFTSKIKPQTARKQWIASALDIQGKITIDDGAVKALNMGNSLLAAGVTLIEGNFKRGALLIIANPKTGDLGQGFISYNSVDARKLIGYHSDAIESLIGYKGPNALIHRDNFVLKETA